MRVLIFLFFPFLTFADVQKCVDDYNSAIVEKNNALSAFKLAKSQKTAADGVISAAERKTYIKEAKASVLSAIDILARSENILKFVKLECIQSIKDKADEISKKNISDLGEFEQFRKDMDLTLQLPK